jgi:hypothetical protein
MMDIDGTDYEEAPCDANVVMSRLVTPYVVIPSIILKSRHHNRAS